MESWAAVSGVEQPGLRLFRLRMAMEREGGDLRWLGIARETIT